MPLKNVDSLEQRTVVGAPGKRLELLGHVVFDEKALISWSAFRSYFIEPSDRPATPSTYHHKDLRAAWRT